MGKVFGKFSTWEPQAAFDQKCSRFQARQGFLFVLLTFILGTPGVVGAAKGDLMNPRCDLTSRKVLPEIHLVGELHDEEASIDFREQLIQDANQGLYVLATEGDAQGALTPELSQARYRSQKGSVSKVYGIESQIPYALLTSFQVQKNFYTKNDEIQDHLEQLFESSRQMPLFKKALDELIASPNVSSLTKSHGAILRNFSQLPGQESSDFIRALDPPADRKNRLRILGPFFDAYHKHVVTVVNRDYPSLFKGKVFRPIEGRVSAVLEKLASKYWLGQMSFVSMKIRDRDFARHIGNVICENSEEIKVVVMMGASHNNGVQKHLKRILGGKGRIQTHLATSDREVRELQCSVRNLCSQTPTLGGQRKSTHSSRR